MKYISATKIMLNKETLGTLTDSIRVSQIRKECLHHYCFSTLSRSISKNHHTRGIRLRKEFVKSLLIAYNVTKTCYRQENSVR